MKIFTVGQLVAYIKNMFSQDYLLRSVTVSGEISNLKYHSSGHVYFTLKDEAGILPAIMFKSNAEKAGWRLADGDKVEASGFVTIYEKSGNYQINVRTIKKSGAGAQHEELERLKKKLEEMGMFDKSYKLALPKYAFRIGVVTSSTGSVIHDIRQVAARRNPGVEIILQPAKVQGEGAAATIIDGIKKLVADNVDVIIIGRGGGSDEDLSAFNDETLAKTIFDCKVPIVSAVGHGDDRSITDLVADVYAPTPSAAAELTVFLFEEFAHEVSARFMMMEDRMQSLIDKKRNALKQRSLRLAALSPSAKIKLKRLAYTNRSEKLDGIMNKKLNAARHLMNIYIEKYKALSPVEKIGHGFAAVTDEAGNKVTTIDSVKAGDRLKLTMREGYIEATATNIEKRE